ncbi:hypothetical protein [Acrocarpospora corrugata]|uniref:hypothetical protein n=1 Tax=Acrocarpospora corrugata TaxID=35763 RepID=UPI001FEC7B46|nr:hypothetical protein [Acrocarpospora corrugata]
MGVLEHRTPHVPDLSFTFVLGRLDPLVDLALLFGGVGARIRSISARQPAMLTPFGRYSSSYPIATATSSCTSWSR